MSYNIENSTLAEVYRRYQTDNQAIRDLQADVCMLRALIERAINEQEGNATVALKNVEGSLGILLKLQSRLEHIDMQRGRMLEKEAVEMLGNVIISIVSDTLRKYLTDEQRHEAVDKYIIPQWTNTIAEAKNTGAANNSPAK